MMKGLMDRCIAREKLVDHLKERAKVVNTGLHELEAWREVQIKKLDITKKAQGESKGHAEALKKVLKDKEEQISLLRKQVLRGKEDGKMKFRNSDGFLYELGDCYANGFNECLHQVKVLFPDLDVSQISLDTVAQTLARSVEPEGTDELFEADPPPMLKVMEKPFYRMNKLNPLRMSTIPLRRPTDHKKFVDEEATIDQA